MWRAVTLFLSILSMFLFSPSAFAENVENCLISLKSGSVGTHKFQLCRLDSKKPSLLVSSYRTGNTSKRPAICRSAMSRVSESESTVTFKVKNMRCSYPNRVRKFLIKCEKENNTVSVCTILNRRWEFSQRDEDS